jgi:hypothetical protein
VYREGLRYNFTDPIYKPAFAKQPERTDPCIPPNGELTIGYGPNPQPLTFSLQAGLNVDVTYVKIFFTSQPIDLSYLSQETPFDSNSRAGNPPLQDAMVPQRNVFDTQVITFLQKRIEG